MEARFPREELNYGVAPQVLTMHLHSLPTIKAPLSKVSSPGETTAIASGGNPQDRNGAFDP
ncbi:hypothetical protein LYNGBM3L_17330 [Moorena producens 3L]|uniref:Uncharacterized protein n=1 Tax=Moorena producens 3L TaxID=489825 RepID=F4XSF4_9CYAN|nr:hypothetical protein LYNGBM3L_17330 [Moorena producens 3L]